MAGSRFARGAGLFHFWVVATQELEKARTGSFRCCTRLLLSNGVDVVGIDHAVCSAGVCSSDCRRRRLISAARLRSDAFASSTSRR
jgi:hypothetical protein